MANVRLQNFAKLSGNGFFACFFFVIHVVGNQS